MANGERARKVENAAGELVGVTLGNDLSRVIPSELANLGLPELRAVFAVRYAAVRPAGPPASTGYSTSRRPSSAAEPATRGHCQQPANSWSRSSTTPPAGAATS
jgi:hypothetical protein